MKRVMVLSLLVVLLAGVPAGADSKDRDNASATTTPSGVRVTIIKSGDAYEVRAVTGAEGAPQEGCRWTLVYTPTLDSAPYGTSPGPMPSPDARLAILLCNGLQYSVIWVLPSDVIDLDAAARAEAERYIQDVLVPAVSIGTNPAAKGLVGLRSWFWIEGFGGTVSAPPISAFGMTIDVRMSTGSVTWDFGDGTVEPGDLGRAYPEESTVQHAHQRSGTYTVRADLSLVPEYRVDGGPWITLPDLTASASAAHPVEERQAVVTGT